MDELPVNHFTKVCRFCLSQPTNFKLISDVPSADIFRILTGIENSNILPQKICLPCEDLFKRFQEFIEKSKSNVNKLKTICDWENSKNHFERGNYENDNNHDTFTENSTVKEEIEEKIDIHKTGIKENQLSKRVHKNKKKYSSSDGNQKKHINLKYKKSAEELKIHKNTSTFKITCKNCKFVFNTKAELSDHCKEGFTCQFKDYQCSECNKIFKKQHKLNNHMRSHVKETPFKCMECGKTFKFQQNLSRHMLIHKGIKKYKCEDCGKAFSRAHVLSEHRNIHTGHNPYICDYCGKGFKRYANHFIHVYRHKLLNGEVDQTKERKLYLQLQCNICNKIFASRGGLENHLTLHQEEPREKRFLCTDCGKGFTTNAQLDSHMRTHTGHRPFECRQCGKKFKQKSTFNNHQLVHSGEKPYQCKHCERLFTQSGHLKVHMRVHSGEKPYSCNFCGKKFALKSNLKVHTRTHTGEKPYVCTICDKGHYDSTSLKKHVKSHGECSSSYVESEGESLKTTDSSGTDKDNGVLRKISWSKY